MSTTQQCYGMSRTAMDSPSCPRYIKCCVLLLNIPVCLSPFTSWDVPGCPDLSHLEQCMVNSQVANVP